MTKERKETGTMTMEIQTRPETDPAVIELQVKAGDAAVHARILAVDSPEMVHLATEDLSVIAGIKKALEDKRKEYVGPLNEHVKAINAAFKAISEPLDIADKALRDKVLAYNREQRELAALAEQVAAAQAKTDDPAVAALSVPDALPVEKAETLAGSMETRRVWKYEVEDFALLPDEYKVANTTMIGGVVKGSKGQITIPGVRIFAEEVLAIEARK